MKGEIQITSMWKKDYFDINYFTYAYIAPPKAPETTIIQGGSFQ